jgi:P-type conjugative transfer protein TrbL
MFVGIFAFALDQGPTVAKAIVDSLFQIGAGGGSASPAMIFDAGIQVANKMSEQVQFGVFEDNALAIAAVFAMVVVVIAFSLVAAIFVAVMVEMYVGLLAGMIMLGLGGSSYTKDFAIRYLIYAFSVGMKLMALVMIAKIGSEVLIGLANNPVATDQQFITALSIAGISVVVFIIAMYVPNILQGVVQGASVTGGMEAIRHGGQGASFAAGAGFLAAGAAGAGFAAAQSARASGSSRGKGGGIRFELRFFRTANFSRSIWRTICFRPCLVRPPKSDSVWRTSARRAHFGIVALARRYAHQLPTQVDVILETPRCTHIAISIDVRAQMLTHFQFSKDRFASRLHQRRHSPSMARA